MYCICNSFQTTTGLILYYSERSAFLMDAGKAFENVLSSSNMILNIAIMHWRAPGDLKGLGSPGLRVCG